MSNGDRPAAPKRQVTAHPGMSEAITSIPVTPGFEKSDFMSSNSYGGQSLEPLKEDANGAHPGQDGQTGQHSQDADVVEIDPRTAHPGLHLSGNVISATFTIPYKIGYNAGADWVGTTMATNASEQNAANHCTGGIISEGHVGTV